MENSLYIKIKKVMEMIQYLKKDDTVGENTSFSYKGLSEEKVMKQFRSAMIEVGLVLLPIDIQSKTECSSWVEETKWGKKNKSSYFTEVLTKYKLVDIDTGEFEIIVSSGHGVDPQDKGAGKAMTYAHKYAILKLFMCPTGDDTDKTHSNSIETAPKTEEIIQKKFETTPVTKKDGTPAVSKGELMNRSAQMLRTMKEGDKPAQRGLMQYITMTDKHVGFKTFEGMSIEGVRITYGKIKKYFKENHIDEYNKLAKEYNW